jgi:hypothetical protein
MNLLIHGTKHGHKSNFNSNLRPLFALNDIRNGVNADTPIGESFYSLSFVNEGCIFSKYTIIRDTLRSHATGNIAFSLLIPFGKELSGKGAQVKHLLDLICKTYFHHYVVDNNINQNKNEIIHEDWNLINSILENYTVINNSESDEQFISGRKDPAYHYYQNEEELIQFLSYPYQEEYKEFEQILFINHSLIGEANPLNVIRNSGIEVNPDLVNPKFIFNYFKSEEGLTIRINDVVCRLGDISVRGNDKIHVHYDKKYHEPINAIGSLSDVVGSEIHKYFKKSGKKVSLNFDNLKLKPQVKSILFQLVKDDNLNESIVGAEVKLSSEKKWVKNLSREFKGSQIGEKFKISARMGTDWESEDNISISPETVDGNYSIVLYPVKRVKIEVCDSKNTNKRITDFKVLVDGQPKELVNNEISLKGTELNAPHSIQIEKDKYEKSELKTINPNNFNSSLEFDLIEIKPIEYKVILGAHGKIRSNKKSLTSKYSDGHDVKTDIKTNWVWSFVRFVPGDEEHTIVAKYKLNPAFIFTLIILPMILMGGSFITYNFFYNSAQEALTQQQIEQYTSGIELNKDTLESYKIRWEAQKSDFIESSISSDLFNPNGNANYDPLEETWNTLMERITRALELRENLNNLKLKRIRESQEFIQMHEIQNLLAPLDDKILLALVDSLEPYTDSIASENLSLINQRLKVTIDKIKTNDKKSDKKVENEDILNNASESSKSTDGVPVSKKKDKGNTLKNSPILDYISGNELKKEKLNDSLKSQLDDDLKKSIKICIDFWDLNTKDEYELKKYITKVGNDKYLKNSKLLRALNDPEIKKSKAREDKSIVLKKYE